MSIVVPLDDHDLDRDEVALQEALAEEAARGEALLDEALKSRVPEWSI